MRALFSMHIGPWSKWIFLKIRFIDDTLRNTESRKQHVKCLNISVLWQHKRVTYAGNFGGFAYSCWWESFPYFPGKYGWIFPFALDDRGDDPGGEEARPAPPDGFRLQESSALVAAQDFTDAPVGNLKYALG